MQIVLIKDLSSECLFLSQIISHSSVILETVMLTIIKLGYCQNLENIYKKALPSPF